MPISEKDIFASLMKDPNHAYNPIEKVWAEAQQRARQFRNNEKALSLAFDDSPALEKLFEFMQKADETPSPMNQEMRDALLANEDMYRNFVGKVSDFNRAKRVWLRADPNNESGYTRVSQTLGIVHDWGKGSQDSTLDSVLKLMNTSAGHLADLLPILQELKNNPDLSLDAALNRSPSGEAVKSFIEEIIRPDGRISPIITTGLNKFLAHEYIQEMAPPDDVDYTDDEEAYVEPSQETDDSVEDDSDVEPSTDAPLESLIEGDDQGQESTSEPTATPEEEAPTPEVRTSDNPFNLNELDALIRANAGGQVSFNPPPDTPTGWETNPKLYLPQFKALTRLGMINPGGTYTNYEWSEAGAPWKSLLAHAPRTQAQGGKDIQALNANVFQAMLEAHNGGYLTGHVSQASVNEHQNQTVDSDSSVIETPDGPAISTTEPTILTSADISNMSPEGWEAYMSEYPHKEVGDYPEVGAEGPLGEVKHLLLPREMGSWEDGTFVQGAPINPLHNAEGTALQDMTPEESQAHLHDMFTRLLDIFHQSNHKDNPDSLSRRFGNYLGNNQAMQEDMWREQNPDTEPTEDGLQELIDNNPFYYKIDINKDGFDKNAYNSYLENNGVLERWLQKFGSLLGIKTNREEEHTTYIPDSQKTTAIYDYNDGGEGSTGQGVPNPATGLPYTVAEVDAYAQDGSLAGQWPENLVVEQTGIRPTRNDSLDSSHPAYNGGIYTPSFRSDMGSDLYIHPQAWEWTDALYSLGLVDPETGYPGFHMLSRTDYDLQGGHGLDYTKMYLGATTIQGMLNSRGLEAGSEEHLWDTVLPQEKEAFQQQYTGAMPGAYNKAFDDFQRYLGNPTAPGDPARVLSEVDPSVEEQEIATRRSTVPSFEEWTQNFLNGDYNDVMGDVWPENLRNAEGLGPNGLSRMHLYKEENARQEGHRLPHALRSDRMERWGFRPDVIGETLNAEAEARRSGEEEGGTPTAVPVTATPEVAPAEGVQGQFDLEGLPATDANHIWVWQEGMRASEDEAADKKNPMSGEWVWKEPTDDERGLLETDLAHMGWETGEGGNQVKVPTPPTPPSIVERNEQMNDLLEQEFGKDWDIDDPEVQGEIKDMLRHHEKNTLEGEHEKRVVIARRTARLKANAEEAKPTKGLNDADKPIEADELERMIAAYKSAVENTGVPVDEDMENWLRGQATMKPQQFRSDYGAALKLNAKHVADSTKRQLQVDANDIDGYRGILPLQQMPTQDDVATQIRRLEYWKNKHGEHMTDSTRKTWNQRWQEITQASASIPDFDIDEFIAADKKNAQEANLEYGSEEHLKTVGKEHVTDMSTNAAYMKAVGEGGALRSNRNHKPWLVIKYDSNGAGTVHDLRQRDERTGEWGKEIDPNSLAFDEDNHWFDYNETPGNQPQQSAAEKFWSKVDRYANFRPLDHRGGLERFDNDDTKFAKTKNLLGEQGVQHGWFHPESGAWINPHRYNDVREELTNAGPGSGMMIPAGEHYHGSHRANGQGEPNPRYAFARRGKAKIAQMNNNNDLSYYVDSQGNINHADAEWSAVQQKDKTQPQTVNDVIHDYYSQQFYNYFTQTADSFKDKEGNFLTGKVLRPQNPPQTPPQQPLQMQLLKEVLEGDALERRRKQGYTGKPQTGSKDLQSDELGHSGEFWGRQQEYQQRYQDVLNYPGSGLLGWIGGIINPFAVASDVGGVSGLKTARGIGRGVKGVVSRALGAKDPSFEAIRRIRRQYRVDAEAEQRTKDVMDKLEVHGHPMRYLSPGESKSRAEDLKDLRTHVGKRVKWHQQEAQKMTTARTRQGTGAPKSQEHQDHDDANVKFQGITNQLNGLNSELDSDWYHINNLYDQYMGNQQVQNKFAPHPSEGDGSWASRFESPPQDYQPSQGGQQASGGLSGLIGDDSPQRSQLQGLIEGNSGSSQRNELQGLIA